MPMKPAHLAIALVSFTLASCGQDGSTTQNTTDMSAGAMDMMTMPPSDQGNIERDMSTMPEPEDMHGGSEDMSAPSTEDMTTALDMTTADMMTAPSSVASCLAHIQNYEASELDYEQYSPTLGSHCFGTNNQQIEGIEKVVFFGDSVTMGTPPLDELSFEAAAEEFANPGGDGNLYRGQLAEMLANRFDLDRGAQWEDWKKYDKIKLKSGVVFPTSRDDFEQEPPPRHSGDFSNCSRSGADNDDLIRADMDGQLMQCFPNDSGETFAGTNRLVPGGSPHKTLVIMTMGGNNIAPLSQEYENDPTGRAALIDKMMEDLRRAIKHLKDPTYFPAGVSIVFANPYGYTDGTGDLESCPGAREAGFANWANQQEYVDMLHDINNRYMQIAMEEGADLLFMDEFFCGHGYVAGGANADTNNVCYRGAGASTWFDGTCIHPTREGHDEIAKMFMAIIEE